MQRKTNDTSRMDLIQKIDIAKDNVRKLVATLQAEELESGVGTIYNEHKTDKWAMYHGDCIEVIKGLPDNSIHYSIFSPPFLSLYVYSDNYQDMGNSLNDEDFYNHFEYLIPQLFRVLKPGRLITVHCSLINMTLQHDGVMGLKDLPGEIVRLFTKHGFIYHSKVNVWKDPLLQAVRTKSLTLAHKQIVKDSTRCGTGFADELLTFRKVGENIEPVTHSKGLTCYIGNDSEPKFDKKENQAINKYSHHVWQRYASPVWMDIDQTDTLNARAGRDEKDERHICPLQLQTIQRCLHLWTNPDDVVLSPFAGIGSEGYESVKNGRKFIGIELKESYYKQAILNLQKAEKQIKPIF